MEVRSVCRLLLCFAVFLQVSYSERGQRPFQSLKAPRETITNYDVISPVIGYRSGQEPHPKELWIFLATPSGNFTLQLELNDQFLHPNFGSTYYDENGNEIVEKGHVNCFYHGRVKGHPEWMFSMSTCHGLQGSFGDINNYFHLEPLCEVDSSLEQPHAFYLASEYSQEEGGCACNETVHPHSPLPPPGIDTAAAIKRRLRRQVNGFLVTELVIVSDFQQYDAHGRNVTATVQRALEVANYIDRLYRVLNIRIVLVGTVTWSNGDQIPIVTDFVQLLNNFMPYQPQIPTPYDSALLFTGVDLDGSTIGFAKVGTMCSDLNSIGLVQDTRRSVESTGGITAHELGHIFNMNHDDDRSCSCADGPGGCIMSASLPFPPPTNWSSCSVSDLNAGFDRGLGRCLTNEPTVTVGDPVCGNGIREGDEVCDCGSSEFGLECTDPCCNATTCELADGAQCHRGSCCQPNCQFTSYGTTCREATNECDILEYCTGDSSDCPRDVHLQDGGNCDINQSLCFSGICRSFDSQCQLHYGSGSRMAVEECYSFWNTQGSATGNCGSTSTAFIPCDQSNILCGQLQCTPGQYTNVAQVGVTLFRANVILVDGSREDCYSFTTNAGSDTPSPGLVQDGSKCGDQRLCFEQRCTAVSDLNYIQPCRVGDNGLVCAGNGLCNNLNLCSCNVGFGGTACQTVLDVNGGGGSNSGGGGGGGGGAIAGAVVGVLLGLGLVIAVVVVVVVIVRKKRTKYHLPTWRTSKSVAKTTAVSSRPTPRPPPIKTPIGEQVNNGHYISPAVTVQSGYDRQSNAVPSRPPPPIKTPIGEQVNNGHYISPAVTVQSGYDRQSNAVPSRPPPPRPAPPKPATVENVHFNEPTANSTGTTQPANFGDSPIRRPPPKPPAPTTHLPTAPPPTYPPPVRSAAQKKQATEAAQPHHASPGHQQSKPHPLPPSKRPPPPKPEQHRLPPSTKPPPRPEDTKPKVPSSRPTTAIKPVKPAAPPKPTLPRPQPSHDLQQGSAPAPPTKPKPAVPAKKPLVPPRK